MKNPKLLSLGAGVAAVAAIAAGTVFALGDSQSTSALGLSNAQVSQIAANVAATPAEERDAYLEKLAANLGVDLQKLKDAITATNNQVIDGKVADGSLTQERADGIRTRMAEGGTWFFAGGPGVPGGHGGHGGHGGPGAPVDREALATFLGVDEATLHTEQEADKSLATIAQEHGKSRDDLKAFLTASLKASLGQAVTGGRLTQAQADAKLAEFTANLDAQIDGTHVPGEGGHRGPRGEFPAPGTTTTPS